VPALRSLSALAVVVALATVAAPAGESGAVARPVFATNAASDPALSSNWAGYAVTAPEGSPDASFTDVTGTWTQTKASCTSGETSAAAFWVGLGGWAETSQALEQIGTEADCSSGGRISYSAWYELVPAGPVELTMKVRPGDRFTGAVLVTGSQVLLSLKNLTRHTRFTKRLPFVQELDTASAEWIAEAPSLCGSSGQCQVVPLTNFGTVTFTRAAAIGNAHPGVISDPSWSPSQVVLAGDASGGIGSGSGSNTHGAVPGSVSADGRSFSVSWRQTLH